MKSLLTPLPRSLYRAAQVRDLDRRATQELWIPGPTLMARAGKAAFRALRQHFPKARRVSVLCGAGNNAGDGFVVARLAREAGIKVRVFHLSDPERLQNEALGAYEAMVEADLSSVPFESGCLEGAELVVDALLGTGTAGEVRAPYREAIAEINASGLPVLALDLPSGLCADSGRVLGTAVRATLTVTFVGLKRGLFTGAGPDHVGSVEFSDLRLPPEVYLTVPPSAELLDLSELPRLLPPRARSAHKGDFGHVLIVGGAPGYAGAARMAAEAAARSGAGLVSIATHPAHAGFIVAQRPELMAHPVQSPADLAPLLARATVAVLGPGLGRDAWGAALWHAVISSDLPLVVDADGLNLLAQHGGARGNWVLTPHPGEAGRLLGSSAAQVQTDRFRAADQLHQRYDAVCILKGAGTLVRAADRPPGVCPIANPGMASGGMGDVLSGIIGALIAQGLSLPDAARLAVCVHGRAAEQAARAGERGMLASDLIAQLRAVVNGEVQ